MAGGPPAPPPPYFTGKRWLLMVVIMALTTFMDVLDGSIANVSLRSIAGAMGVSPAQGTWVITSYTVANAVAVPLSGWLAQRFGQVRLFVAATAVFTVTSWLCGFSADLSTLIAARVVQGTVAGFMISLSQALMLNTSPPHMRTIALAIWSMTITVSPVVGPLLGGWITDDYSWRWIFYINIVPGIVASVVAWHLFKDRETLRTRTPVDTVGLVLLVLWVGSLQIMLDKGNELDWFENPWIIGLTIVAGVGFCFFMAWELTDSHPVVDLSLFRYRNFSAGVAALGLGFAVYFANMVLLPLLLQTQYGLTATWAGRIVAPMTILAVFCAPLYGWLMTRYDPRYFATIGFTVFAICSYWRSRYTPDADIWLLMAPQFIQGIGSAGFFAPLINISTRGIPAAKMASASGFQNFFRMMLASFAASVMVTAWDHRASMHRTHLVEALPAHGPRLTHGLDALHRMGLDGQAAYRQIEQTIGIQSYVLAANDLFLFSSALFVVLMGLIWIARPSAPGAKGRDAAASAH